MKALDDMLFNQIVIDKEMKAYVGEVLTVRSVDTLPNVEMISVVGGTDAISSACDCTTDSTILLQSFRFLQGFSCTWAQECVLY